MSKPVKRDIIIEYIQSKAKSKNIPITSLVASSDELVSAIFKTTSTDFKLAARKQGVRTVIKTMIANGDLKPVQSGYSLTKSEYAKYSVCSSYTNAVLNGKV